MSARFCPEPEDCKMDVIPTSPPNIYPMKFSRDIELHSHIVNSGISAIVMDLVVKYNGDFNTEEFSPRQQKKGKFGISVKWMKMIGR